MQLSQLLAITPGGLGVVEAGSASGLALAGVDGDAIAAFLVGQRVFIISARGLGAQSYVPSCPKRHEHAI